MNHVIKQGLSLAARVLSVSYSRVSPIQYATGEEDFRSAITNNGHDADLQGVYADWIDENAQDRAEEAAQRRELSSWLKQSLANRSPKGGWPSLNMPPFGEYHKVAVEPVDESWDYDNLGRLGFLVNLTELDHKDRDDTHMYWFPDIYQAWLFAQGIVT